MNNDNKTSAPEEKHRMIEKAAYYRGEKRGSFDDDPVKDWLEAEREIDASFQHPDGAGASEQERAAYQRMRAEFKKILTGAQDKINDRHHQAGLRPGEQRAQGTGGICPGKAVDRAGKRLKQEVAAAVEKMGPRWDAFSEKSHGLFEIWKDKGGQFVNQAYTALNAWVRRYRDKNGKE